MSSRICCFIKKHIISHIAGWIVASILGGIATAALFFFTASPSSSAEVRSKLSKILVEELRTQENIDIDNITYNTTVSQPLDLSADNSIFIHVSATNENNMYSILAVYEPKKESILDRIVGRQSFYKLASYSIMPVMYSNSLLPKKIEVKDFDIDGNKEIVITVTSSWADSNSEGIIILKKNDDEIWRFLSLQSLTQIISATMDNQLPHPNGLSPVSHHYGWFSLSDTRITNRNGVQDIYLDASVYEDHWEVLHNGQTQEFITIRNGSQISEMQHPILNHTQFGIVANVADGNAVLSPHHLIITFFKLGDMELERDLLWNWGYPMLSTAPEEISEIDIREFHEVGISAHIHDGTFFGYTEFQSVHNN